jgi:aminocarboxymuconate-semialdehyde decarboxylase
MTGTTSGSVDADERSTTSTGVWGPVIDVHAHAVPSSLSAADTVGHWHGLPVARTEQQLLRVSPAGGSDRVLPWSHAAENVARRLADMDATGVDYQVLSLLPSLWWFDDAVLDGVSAARQCNDDFIALAEEHPQRFRVFAHLPLHDPRAAVAELERAMKSEVVVGAAVSTHVNGRNWDDPQLFPILEAADRLGALLFFHPAAIRLKKDVPNYHLSNLIGNPTETTIAIASLIFGNVLERLPSVRMVFAHGGGYACMAIGRFDHGRRVRKENAGLSQPPSAYLPRLYFDTIVHSDAALRFLVDTVGADRVVLASDYPADMGPEDPVAVVRDNALLTEQEMRAILGGNLALLLGIEVMERR